MACITLFAPPLAMATTQLARAVRYEAAPVWQLEAGLERTRLHMSWVVTTGSDGKPQLRIRWTSDC
jgi:hypothetical protein